MSVYLLATLDTKGHEAAFVRERLMEHGVHVKLVDVGSLDPPQVPADVNRDDVFRAAGTSAAEVAARGDRGRAVASAAEGAAKFLRAAFDRGQLDGVLGLGGSAGTTIGTAAMRTLPLGVPKLMASTLASGQVRPWVADKDILMLNTVVDIAGLNRISRTVLAQSAAAMAGMVKFRQVEVQARAGDASPRIESPNGAPLIAATMFGVTTPCVQHARGLLEAAGYEVLVFHATGNGGQAMESLIREGLIAGVLDLTTTELADELVGGILSAGPTRLTAATEMGVPQVVSVGALDMVNFGPLESVPEKFCQRKFHVHNPTVTLMRTTPQECRQLGEQIGEKLHHCQSPCAVLFPEQGVSALDAPGKPFDDPAARQSLVEGIQSKLGNGPIRMERLPYHINDPPFAAAAAGKLLEMLAAQAASTSA